MRTRRDLDFHNLMIRKGIKNKEGIYSLDLPIWWTEQFSPQEVICSLLCNNPTGTQLLFTGKTLSLAPLCFWRSAHAWWHSTPCHHPSPGLLKMPSRLGGTQNRVTGAKCNVCLNWNTHIWWYYHFVLLNDSTYGRILWTSNKCTSADLFVKTSGYVF